MKRKRALIILILLLAAITALITVHLSSVKATRVEAKQETAEVQKTAPEKTTTSGGQTAKEFVPEKYEILTLYDGRKYLGSTLSRGEKVVFKTSKGTMEFPSDTVRDIRIFR